MVYLIASLLALALGPFLATWARRFRPSTIAVDSFVLVVLGGLVLLHILPHALEATGLWALLVAAAGFFVTGSAERSLRSGAGASRFGRRLFFALALAGLGIHAVIDGMALIGAELPHDNAPGESHEHGSIWALAVLFHRVPFAISLWWIVAPLIGVRTAVLSMAVIAIGTVVGYAVGEAFLATASPSTLGLFEALLCGTLLHVVLHADLPPAPKGAEPWLTRIATLCGLAGGIGVVFLVDHGHAHGAADGHDHGMGATFLELALESAPALLLAYVAVGLAHAFLPGDFLGRRTRGQGLGGALRGVAIGIPLPICSCGVVPMYRDLIRRGAGIAAGIAFLIATPELEFAAILLTWNLLGPEVAAARVVTAALLALGVAVAVARLAPRATADADASQPPIDERPVGFGPRIRRALHTGLVEAVDETSAWILLGLGAAAFLTPLLDPTALAGVPSLVAVPAAALLGMPLYVCASGSTPLAAVLVAKGLSPGAAIAFLLTGPATNVTTFGVLSRLHDRRTAVAFATLMFLGASAAGLATDALLAPPASEVAGDSSVHVHNHGTLLQWACTLVLAAVVAASLLRQGIRRYLGQLLDTPSLAELTGGPAPTEKAHSCCH